MPEIKICGIRRPEDVSVINELLPDYAGFILTARFWRYTDPETALKLRKMMDPGVKTVGVFVDETPEYIAGFVQSGTINAVQLHGKEDNDYIASLRALIGSTTIIKAFKIRSREDADRAVLSSADMILLDNGTGTGETFDWSIIRDGVDRPFFLAGGLGPDNVSAALKECMPFGVDVSSGVETDKLKDPAKMRAFVSAVRNYTE